MNNPNTIIADFIIILNNGITILEFKLLKLKTDQLYLKIKCFDTRDTEQRYSIKLKPARNELYEAFKIISQLEKAYTDKIPFNLKSLDNEI